jgi:NADH-quinone oxidoreductase subunit A
LVELGRLVANSVVNDENGVNALAPWAQYFIADLDVARFSWFSICCPTFMSLWLAVDSTFFVENSLLSTVGTSFYWNGQNDTFFYVRASSVNSAALMQMSWEHQGFDFNMFSLHILDALLFSTPIYIGDGVVSLVFSSFIADLGGFLYLWIYLLLIVFIILVILCAIVLLTPRTKNFSKEAPYECGFDPVGDARQPFDIHFYLVAILFLVFDLELVIFFPWVFSVVENSIFFGFNFATIMFFFFCLGFGLVFEWMAGVLDWSFKPQTKKTKITKI